MGHGGDRGRGLNVDGNAMTKKMTDREMLQACLDAMEVSQSNGGLSDWKYMIAGLREHLQDEPTEKPFNFRDARGVLAEPKADPVEARARENFNLAHGINEGAWDRQQESEKLLWRDAARRQLNRSENSQ